MRLTARARRRGEGAKNYRISRGVNAINRRVEALAPAVKSAKSNAISIRFQDQVLVIHLADDLLLEIRRHGDAQATAAIDPARHAAHYHWLMYNRDAVAIAECINVALPFAGLSAIEHVAKPREACRRSPAERLDLLHGAVLVKRAGVVIGTGEEQDQGEGEIFFHGSEVGQPERRKGCKRKQVHQIWYF